MRFNYILSNPPYRLGNLIIGKSLEFSKNVVFLVPMSKLYKNYLYKSVYDLTFVDEDGFDAVISGNLNVCALRNDLEKPLFETKESLELLSYNKKYFNAYLYNINHPVYWKTSSPHSNDMVIKETDFFFRARGMAMGVIKNNTGIDYQFNMGDLTSDKLPMAVHGTNDVFTHLAGYIIRFNTPLEKQNLCDFYYRNGGRNLMNELLLGMNKNDGTPFYAIPHVDWTRKWSDEEIAKELGISN